MKVVSNNSAAQPGSSEHTASSLPTAAHTAPKRVPWTRLLILGLLAAALVWVVTTRSLVAYLAGVDPEAALSLQSNNPAALLSLAARELSSHQAPTEQLESSQESERPPSSEKGQPPTNATGSEEPRSERARPRSAKTRPASDVRAWTEVALINDPLNARAFSLLGHLSQNDVKTEALMAAAVRRSLHQRAAAYWMMQWSYEKGNFRGALRYADILLRTRPQAIQSVMPVLGKIAELEEGRGELKELLATAPPWRAAFFSHLPMAIQDARTPLNLLLGLSSTSIPPSIADIRSYVSFLIEHKFYDLAYYVWLQFLTPAQLSGAGQPFNGGFEAASSGLPFDWTFAETAGTAVRMMQPKPGVPDQHAMFLEFGPGRVDFRRDVRQMILLAPGQYQFRGRQKLDVASQRGLKWEIRCTDGNAIGASPLAKGTRLKWEQFTFSFSVPEQGCPAQYVQLNFDARSESERFISGTVWYDDLQIEREASTDPGISRPEEAATERSP